MLTMLQKELAGNLPCSLAASLPRKLTKFTKEAYVENFRHIFFRQKNVFLKLKKNWKKFPKSKLSENLNGA